MGLPYEWVVGWRYTRRGRTGRRNGFLSFISGVSMLGIALGVAALIIVMSVVNGFQREVRERMLAVVSHIELFEPYGRELPSLAQQTRLVSQHPGVVAVAPYVAAQGLLARGEDIKAAQLRGIDPAAEARVTAIADPAVLARLQAGGLNVLLGSELASSLGVAEGDTVSWIEVRGQRDGQTLPRVLPLTVAGTVDTGHFEYDATLALVHLSDATRMLRLEGPNGLRIRIAEPDRARAVAQALSRELEPGQMLRDWTRHNATWFAALVHQKRMLFLILVLIVAVAAFNLVSTLVMTVTDKRADIAILRTLGASPRSIMAIFVVQGAMVGLFGTAAGLLLGLGIAANVDTLVPALEQILGTQFLSKDVYLIDHLPSDPQRGDIVPVGLISLALALLSTLYPSWRASRVNPAEALKYD
ncbi:MAG TPA: lipoprotein-releasing ABC transporter permease subunit [Burkholderiaceae bacterium]|nr:lipoprotein-releasing ABC transporter permease subunit [Burkholderiaceae bacterium]